MKVLVVDDSSTVRQQVRAALAAEGHETVDACDGVEGLEQVRDTPDIRVVICDVNMPRMNGIEMLEALHTAGGKVPVLMLTTEGQPSLIKKAREFGARGWMVKPFKPELLLLAVNKLGTATQ